jgi:hypothetical protein
MTLKGMASAIRNHVVDGLKGVTNEAFSTEQLLHEILIETNALIQQGVLQGTIDPTTLHQRVDGIETECADLSRNCSVPSLSSHPRILVPKLYILRDAEDSISFLGSVDNLLQIKLYFDADYRYHQYNIVTKDKPYAYVNVAATNNGMSEIFFFNLDNYENLKYVSLTALFEDPYKWLETEYKDQFISSEFYAPKALQSQVIAVLTQKYVNYYRQMNTPLQPNTQEKQ